MRICDWSSDVYSSDLLTLSGVANWLACTDKVCVPEKAVISVALKAGDGAISDAARTRFDGWRALLPPPHDRHGTWERRGAKVRFAIPLDRKSGGVGKSGSIRGELGGRRKRQKK